MLKIKSIGIPGCIGFTEEEDCKIELVIFSDPSKLAYGAIAYVKVSNDKTKCLKSTFLLAKPRVAPLKEKSLIIPGLELQAAVLTVGLNEKIIHLVDFEFNEVHFFSDSRIILSCIRNSERKFRTLVMQSINKIRKSNETKQWNYIPEKFHIVNVCT